MRVRLTGARRAMIVSLAAVLGIILAAPANAKPIIIPDTPPPAGSITIDIVNVNGSGCKPGTAAVAVSPDNHAFTVTYSEYQAVVGVGAGPLDFRRNCQINVKVNVPGGFTYAVAQADYRGYASLAKGATAKLNTSVYFTGLSETLKATHNFKGALDDSWQETDKVEVAALIWHPCGEKRLLAVNTDLRAAVGTSDPKKTTSLITMDSTDGSVTTLYHFSWMKCPKV
jgi:hypothetical protein